jgi:hypothetical protein
VRGSSSSTCSRRMVAVPVVSRAGSGRSGVCEQRPVQGR